MDVPEEEHLPEKLHKEPPPSTSFLSLRDSLGGSQGAWPQGVWCQHARARPLGAELCPATGSQRQLLRGLAPEHAHALVRL